MQNKYFVRAQSKHVFINRIDICIENEVILRYTEKNASFFFLFLFHLFPFNFIDAEERNASLDKNIKNWILVIFRTCIIYKLTASCLRLSFHLTFKFLVLKTNHQFFLFFVLKCKTKIQSGRSYADFFTLKSEDLTTKSWCVSLSIWTF